jgi:hypothetical protein
MDAGCKRARPACRSGAIAAILAANSAVAEASKGDRHGNEAIICQVKGREARVGGDRSTRPVRDHACPRGRTGLRSRTGRVVTRPSPRSTSCTSSAICTRLLRFSVVRTCETCFFTVGLRPGAGCAARARSPRAAVEAPHRGLAHAGQLVDLVLRQGRPAGRSRLCQLRGPVEPAWVRVRQAGEARQP